MSVPRPMSAAGRPRAVVFAFSAEPGRGSEPGGGWGMLMALSRIADLTVLVKSEHVPGIREWERRNPGSGLTFVEIPPAAPPALWKVHRITEFLVYLLWLRAAYRKASELHLEDPFDFAHHITYSVYWLPTPATRLGIPCIWGPVAGGVRAPRVLWPYLGIWGLFDELLDRFAVAMAALTPATRRTWREAAVRIVQNEDTRQRLAPGLRDSTHVLNAAELTRVHRPPSSERAPVAVFPSALESRKCPRLALEALVHAPAVRLQFVHTGPQEPMLRRLATRLGVSDRVEFLGRIPRSELFDCLSRASVAVFSGVREEGGLALAEALSLGTPVVVLSIGGARTICEGCPDPSRVTLVDPDDPRGAPRALGEAMAGALSNPSPDHTPNLDASGAEARLHRLIERAIGRPALPSPSGGRQSPVPSRPGPLESRSTVASATGGE